MTDLPKEYGTWFRAHRWTHWVHLTVDPKVERRTTRRIVRHTLNGAERTVVVRRAERAKRRAGRAGRCPRTVDGIKKAFEEQFVRYCTKVLRHRVPYAFVVELGHSGSNPHIHALLYGTEDIPCARLAEVWRHGRAKVQLYDPSRNAATYMAKEAGESDFTWDCSRTLPPLWDAPRDGGSPRYHRGSLQMGPYQSDGPKFSSFQTITLAYEALRHGKQ